MPRPKTDQEIQKTWTPLQWKFMYWYDANTAAICECSAPGAAWNAFDKLVAKFFPDKKDQQAFDVWADEWLDRHAQRLMYKPDPKEFIAQVMATNFTDNQATSELLKTIAFNDMPWIPIGRSKYGGVSTYYAFKPKADYLRPDLVVPGPDVIGDYILAMKLESKTRSSSGLAPASTSSNVFNPSSRPTSVGETAYLRERASTATTFSPTNFSPTKENPNKASDKDGYLVFAQIGTLYVYGGKYFDANPKNMPKINKGPWWLNGFAVVVQLSNKGQPGAVYVVYNDAPSKKVKYKEYDGPDEELLTDLDGAAANHVPGKLHPKMKVQFTVAKIAESMNNLGNLMNVFNFEEVATEKRPIQSTRIVTNKNKEKFILHANLLPKQPPTAGGFVSPTRGPIPPSRGPNTPPRGPNTPPRDSNSPTPTRRY
ncbi:hypothetical protein FCOIX_11271 [Fusarium coicis]|nr:hypothetical protein FCOIX_11271 [Fusarium coicis]